MKQYPKIRIEEFDKIIKLVDEDFIKQVDERVDILIRNSIEPTPFMISRLQTIGSIKATLKENNIAIDDKYLPAIHSLYVTKRVSLKPNFSARVLDELNDKDINKDLLLKAIDDTGIDKDIILCFLNQYYASFQDYDYISLMSTLLDESIHKISNKPNTLLRSMNTYKLHNIAKEEIPNTEISEEILLNSFMNEFNDLLKRYKIVPDTGDHIYNILESMFTLSYNSTRDTKDANESYQKLFENRKREIDRYTVEIELGRYTDPEKLDLSKMVEIADAGLLFGELVYPEWRRNLNEYIRLNPLNRAITISNIKRIDNILEATITIANTKEGDMVRKIKDKYFKDDMKQFMKRFKPRIIENEDRSVCFLLTIDFLSSSEWVREEK